MALNDPRDRGTLPYAGRGTENGKGRAIQGPGNNSRKEGYNSAEDNLIAKIDRKRKEKPAPIQQRAIQAIPVSTSKPAKLSNRELTEMEMIFARYK